MNNWSVDLETCDLRETHVIKRDFSAKQSVNVAVAKVRFVPAMFGSENRNVKRNNNQKNCGWGHSREGGIGMTFVTRAEGE